MRLYSTWYYDDDEEKIKALSLDAITPDLKRSERISIISAYYSTDFIKKILSKVNKTKRKKCILKLVVNGLSGQRLHEQIKDLKTLKTSLSTMGFCDISILINRETALCHTKLYYIKNDKGSVWLAGSANASNSAFQRNEEILIKSKSYINNIKRYISYVIDDSVTIEDVDLENTAESNIIGFFRTGSIYFKPSNQLSFTFSELKLPDWVEEKLSNINERPRNTNPGKAWGSYNLKIALGLSAHEKDEKNTQISLKPWSIETCFGYWVPNKYRAYVKENIIKKSTHNKNRFLEILGRIDTQGEDSLITDYKEYLCDAKQILKKNNIDFDIDEKDLAEKFEKFLNRIIAKLNNPKKLERLCSPLLYTGMPEIWEDNIAFDEFSESYFEYINSCLNEQRLPTVVRSIIENMEIVKEADTDMVAGSFRNYFDDDDAEWSDEYWYEK